MIWSISNRADPFAREIADRHYNRQKIGSPQFVPPGRCCVLKAQTLTGKAFWVTSWPFAEYVKHAWPGAWVCSAFRNEGADKASSMILDALKATRYHLGEPPKLGMITFLDTKKVLPTLVRGKVTYGRTWSLAGFSHVGWTKGGLMAWQINPENIPEAEPAMGDQSKFARMI
jgi:hypothetical protein